MTSPFVVSIIPKSGRESVRIALEQSRDDWVIDIRLVTLLNSVTGIPIPTQKGLSLKVEQLPALIEALQDAEKEARNLGLVEVTP